MKASIPDRPESTRRQWLEDWARLFNWVGLLWAGSAFLARALGTELLWCDDEAELDRNRRARRRRPGGGRQARPAGAGDF